MNALQLRMLIRIDECRLAHYQQMIDHATEESTAAAMECARDLKERWALCLQRIQFRRARLAYIGDRQRVAEGTLTISPAASYFATAVPSNGGAQPETLQDS